MKGLPHCFKLLLLEFRCSTLTGNHIAGAENNIRLQLNHPLYCCPNRWVVANGAIGMIKVRENSNAEQGLFFPAC